MDMREGVRSEEERKEDRGRKRGGIKAISRKEGGESVKVGTGEGVMLNFMPSPGKFCMVLYEVV